MSDNKIDAEKRILEMQRDLMSEIMNFQIEYGAESVSWNINIQFARKERK